MLPYTPLHHLLYRDFGGALVMTSGNLSDEPIAFEDGEARRAARRDRGRVPRPRPADPPPLRGLRRPPQLPGPALPRVRALAAPAARPPLPLVAAGAELKSTFCVATGDGAFLSPHLGDLDSEAAYRAFVDDLELYLDMLGVRPEAIACDLHPEYLSTKWAHEQGLPLVEVQHHHAHAAACLAEHGEDGPALALVFDGTGLGTDGTLWGGELLRCDLASFERLAGLDPFPLPGRRGGDPRAVARRRRPPRAGRASPSPGRAGRSSARA